MYAFDKCHDPHSSQFCPLHPGMPAITCSRAGTVAGVLIKRIKTDLNLL